MMSAVTTCTRRYLVSSSTLRTYHSSSKLLKSQKDLFTPSPFANSDTIPINDELVIQRELLEGNKAYGVRRYLLLPRNEFDEYSLKENQKDVIASVNANQNIIFGLRLHSQTTTSTSSSSGVLTNYLNACGPLVDVAKEDASMNAQQPQALCTLNGLCDWVKECLDENGKGSTVLDVLMHEVESDSSSPQAIEEEEDENNLNEEEEDDDSTVVVEKHMSKQRIQNRSKSYTVQNETQRQLKLEAITAIATSTPRPGHSVLGAGTYRDGREPWIHLAWEYTKLCSPWDKSCRTGLEELMVYKSRDGEVGAIEHLAHKEESYLKSAGGAMARVFFV